MRRHAKASSSGSNERKPSGHGSSLPSGRFRLTILLATVAAFLLVPVAQAAANGTLTVSAEGTGKGEASSVGGLFDEGYSEGSPPIECSYASPGPATGNCATGLVEDIEPGLEAIWLAAIPAPGSEVAGIVVEEGFKAAECKGACFYDPDLPADGVGIWIIVETGEGNAAVTAIFEREVCKEECGPTNKRTLTVTKSGTPNSAGTVKSKPKGINCAAACSKAEASLYKNAVVTLTEKPASGSTFTEWTGACSGSGETCTVTMTEAKSVNAVFGGASKEIVNPKTLTLSKEGTGYGTVKATGLACEADCTETEVSYTGGVTEPKVKAAATATLVATKAPGSEFNGWSGCDSEPEGKCVVSMSAAKSVSAEFTALPKNTLTVKKSGPKNAAGTVKAKPKAVNCGSACTEGTASLSEDSVVTLTAKAASGSTFTGWSGAGCSGTGNCVVTMSSAKEVTAEFGGASKEIVNAKTLTLTKAGSGYGTVKATGLSCEVLCTSTAVSYFGGVTEPKPKAAATVTLEGMPAAGSQAVSWSGCDTETEGKCIVTMSAAKAVTATFDELE